MYFAILYCTHVRPEEKMGGSDKVGQVRPGDITPHVGAMLEVTFVPPWTQSLRNWLGKFNPLTQFKGLEHQEAPSKIKEGVCSHGNHDLP